jgi:hypothetical protein
MDECWKEEEEEEEAEGRKSSRLREKGLPISGFRNPFHFPPQPYRQQHLGLTCQYHVEQTRHPEPAAYRTSLMSQSRACRIS